LWLHLRPQSTKAGSAVAASDSAKRREEAKKQLFKGIDILGDGDDAGITDDADMPTYKRALLALQAFVDRHLPLQNDLKAIEVCTTLRCDKPFVSK
jgi:hypothetical protein